jgi:hypothetical protein
MLRDVVVSAGAIVVASLALAAGPEGARLDGAQTAGTSGAGNPTREIEARAPIDAFFAAFNARDNDALKKTLHYPHVRINEAGGVNVWKDASEAGTNFEGLTRAEGWASSSLDSVSMRQNDAIKVHFDVVFSRYKADGTKYATYQSLWIVTKKDGRWGVQARSSFAP